MLPFSLFFLVSIFSCASFSSSAEMEAPNPSPEAFERNSRLRGQPKETESCKTGNPMDDCWRCDPEWHSNNNRKMLANCAVGFGRDATGGRDGEFYVVTDPDNDDPLNPIKGTLRYAAIQEEPLWIIFNSDMVIRLKDELLVNSFKTIDGRGANVEIEGGPCITLSYVTNIIIHGIHIHHCVPGGNATVRTSPTQYGWRNISDGDGISIFSSAHIWIDHCSLSYCHDGLIDVTYGSTSVTISNNHMAYHDEVMLMGHSDDFLPDKDMQVTIAFNYFGEGLVQRIPRCRHGYFHIVNNLYSGWELYAVGGSANPTINSQGNIYMASDGNSMKEVTRRILSLEDEWKVWNWRSVGDLMLNGAFFTSSGNSTSQNYVKASSMIARPTSLLTILNVTAGALSCQIGYTC